MASYERILKDIDRRLEDPYSLTPSMSFNDSEIKPYSELFRTSKGYSAKTWEPGSSQPTRIPLRPQGDNPLFPSRTIDSSKERKRLEDRLKSYTRATNKPVRPNQTVKLYDQAAILTRKRENLRIQHQRAEKTQTCSPKILQRSRELVKGRVGKVEDRLIAHGLSIKQSLDEEQRLQHSQERRPQITAYASSLKPSAPVVDRLLIYSKFYQEKRAKAQTRALSYTFSPMINEYQGIRPALTTPKPTKTPELSYSFKPQLNNNSLKIAAKLKEQGPRTTSHKRASSAENFTFKPVTNSTKSSVQIKPETNRWEYLYGLNIERRKKLEMLRKAFEEKEKDFECTFYPNIIKKSLGVPKEETVQRLNDWESRRVAKISAARSVSCEKEDEECTFQPFLYEAVAQETMNGFYEELAKKKKQGYVEIHREKCATEKTEWESEKVAPMFMSDINSNEYDEAIKELHDLLHIQSKKVK